jgi:hypothetical protein
VDHPFKRNVPPPEAHGSDDQLPKRRQDFFTKFPKNLKISNFVSRLQLLSRTYFVSTKRACESTFAASVQYNFITHAFFDCQDVGNILPRNFMLLCAFSHCSNIENTVLWHRTNQGISAVQNLGFQGIFNGCDLGV